MLDLYTTLPILENEILTSPFEVSGTKELINYRLRLDNIEEGNFEAVTNDLKDFKLFLANSLIGIDCTFKSYKSKDYVQMFKDVIQLLTNMDVDETNEKFFSRQNIVTCPKLHCFTSFQFLIRNGTINLICNMRSCNFEDNLVYDMFICYWFTQLAKVHLCMPKSSVVIDMNISSLHIFLPKVKEGSK